VPFQPTWGGPTFVTGTDLSDASFAEVLVRTTIGGVAFVALLYACWLVFGRRLWAGGDGAPALHPR
jgi:hypothetical protein